MTYPIYFEALDAKQMLADYPLDLVGAYGGMSRDELHALQNARFVKLMERGWQIPFYQRLWGEKGIEPADVRGLQDIGKLPVYDKSDLMASVNAYPPYGDFDGRGSDPVVFHTTSGTTGRPQPLMFGPKGREITNLLVGRMYRWMGLRPDDVVQSVYGHGMINGGHYIREAVTHFTNSLFLSAGTGIETRSLNQVNLMADFGVTVMVGFVDYVRKLAEVAEAEGMFDRIALRMIIGHLGTEDRASTEAAWHGAKAYDWYGVGDTGSIAGEGPERDGLYVWEDAQYLELLDVDHGTPVGAGETGDMVVTCLFKDDIAPCIRFNTHDITHELGGRGEIGFKRIAGFKGRSDNMVKLRGINLFPHAIGAIIESRPDLTGEYVCRLTRDPATQRDDMLVMLESRGGTDEAQLAALLRQGLGVEVGVVLCAPGGTAAQTQIEVRQKPIRLIDERGL
jgi:phenylacetate-CoA ligase